MLVYDNDSIDVLDLIVCTTWCFVIIKETNIHCSVGIVLMVLIYVTA